MASQDARLSKFEADFKQQQSETTNKIDTVLKAITDRIAGAPPSDTTGMGMEPLQTEEPEPSLKDEFPDLHLNLPVLEIRAHALIYNALLDNTLGNSKPFNTLADLGSCVNIIPLYLFKKLNVGLLEEIDPIFGLADGTKSYPVGIVKDVEVHIGKLKLLNDFYVIDMKKDPETSLLVGTRFLATANAVIDYKKSQNSSMLETQKVLVTSKL
ncbi:DNA-directed DNA polymerase [Tanacetum coccineum]